MGDELRERTDDTELSASGRKVGEGERLVELDLELGTKIGRYVLIEQIGRGGMGVIWAAYDPQLDRKVALKLLLMDGLASRTRLEREAQALARLDHPNVVRIHDVGVYEGQVWLAMEFIDGQTLRAWLKARRPSWREVRGVMMGAGRGLAAAHAEGLVHRDFKPENVMIDAKGRVVVMDFGLVRHEDGPADGYEGDDEELEPDERGYEDVLLDSDAGARTIGDEVMISRTPTLRKAAPPSASSSFAMLGIPEVIAEDEDISRPFDTNITRGGAVMGTPAYMAPEQHASIPTDARADQFGFCVTLWEAVYGQRPFAGTSLSGLALSVSKGDIKDPPRGAKVPQWLRRMMERGLAPKREDRFADMSALLDALGHEPRWRWVALSAFVCAALVAGLIWARGSLAQSQALEACEAESAEIHASWDAAVEARLEAAFVATERAGAAQSWAQVSDYVGSWVERWANTRGGLCVEGEVEGTRSVAELAAARACLDHQRAGFDELLTALGEVEASSIHDAVLSAAGLPMPTACVQRGRTPMMVPDEAALADEVARLRAALHRADALRGLGRYEDSLRASEAVIGEVEALEWLPLEAELRYVQGQAERDRGDYEAAERSLEAAFILAGRANHELLMAKAAVALARVLGDFQARHVEGSRWTRIAALYFERAGLADTPELGTLELARGRIAQVAGDYEAAQVALEGALALFERNLGAEHPQVANALNNLGNCHLSRGDAERSLATLERAEAIYVAALGAGHPRVAVALNNQGNAYAALRRYDDALAVFERALELRQAAFGPDHPDVGTALNNLGTAYISMERYDEALEVMTRALEIREASLGPKHPRVGTTLNNIGRIHFRLGEHQAALGYYEQAYELRKATLGPRHDRVAGPLVNIGEVLLVLGEAQRALEAAAQARDIYVDALGPEHVQVVDALTLVARASTALGEHERATAALREARKLLLAKYGEGAPQLEELERTRRELARQRRVAG